MGKKHTLFSLSKIGPFRKEPNMIIGGIADPYLVRWYLIPKNKFFNIYLHRFMRSDDDRALHDHPWWNMSILLKGSYIEHVPHPSGNKNLTKTIIRKAPCIAMRKATAAHRVELYRNYRWIDGQMVLGRPAEVWTLFITGPRIREWGFHCPKGWIFWKDFVSNDGIESKTGKGCDQ